MFVYSLRRICICTISMTSYQLLNMYPHKQDISEKLQKYQNEVLTQLSHEDSVAYSMLFECVNKHRPKQIDGVFIFNNIEHKSGSTVSSSVMYMEFDKFVTDSFYSSNILWNNKIVDRYTNLTPISKQMDLILVFVDQQYTIQGRASDEVYTIQGRASDNVFSMLMLESTYIPTHDEQEVTRFQIHVTNSLKDKMSDIYLTTQKLVNSNKPIDGVVVITSVNKHFRKYRRSFGEKLTKDFVINYMKIDKFKEQEKQTNNHIVKRIITKYDSLSAENKQTDFMIVFQKPQRDNPAYSIRNISLVPDLFAL